MDKVRRQRRGLDENDAPIVGVLGPSELPI